MKPTTVALLAAASRDLSDANANLRIAIPHQAARIAYYAMFHAAQALIVERLAKPAKRHAGLRKQFHALAASDPRLGRQLAASLTRAYQFKEAADYETATESVLTNEEAADAIAVAENFVVCVRQVLATPPTDES